MKESRDNSLDIMGNEVVVRRLLEFLYTGTIGDHSNLLLEDAISVFQLAHMYLLPALMMIVKDVILKLLTPDKALITFKMINTLAEFDKDTKDAKHDKDAKHATTSSLAEFDKDTKDAKNDKDAKHGTTSSTHSSETAKDATTSSTLASSSNSSAPEEYGLVQECQSAALMLSNLISNYVAKHAAQDLSLMIRDVIVKEPNDLWTRKVRHKPLPSLSPK